MPAELKSTIHGMTMVLTLSHPEHRNALGPSIYAAGVEALGVAENNPEIRSVVISGEGHHFSAGDHLQHLSTNRHESANLQSASLDALHNWIEDIRTFPKPVIAVVEGAATGAGFSLVLACDMVIAARNAVFSMTYGNIGLSPDGGASWSLAQSLPRQLASEILMLGDRMPADRLHALGLVNRLAEPGQAFDDALNLAERINAMAPNALACIKELLSDAPTNTLHQHLAAEQKHFVKNLFHENAGIGLNAFLEKKVPKFV